ncbi:hypothetical protein [Moraxella lacunata]|uniref:hypothetical protein n=1 Tax=Moraxella lacunata TaxID=477 RepID=UPI003EE417A5
MPQITAKPSISPNPKKCTANTPTNMAKSIITASYQEPIPATKMPTSLLTITLTPSKLCLTSPPLA